MHWTKHYNDDDDHDLYSGLAYDFSRIEKGEAHLPLREQEVELEPHTGFSSSVGVLYIVVVAKQQVDGL